MLGGTTMYLVCYDITSDKIRNKVAKELENFGKRVQYSVFECNITQKRFKELYTKLLELTEKMEDGNIRIYQLDQISEKKLITIGNTEFISDDKSEEDVIFV